jgi:N-acyl homoserine lactone hydrolase
VKIHPIRTGHAWVHRHHPEAPPVGPARRLLPLIERSWAGPFPVLSWVIEHPEGIIVVDSGACHAAEGPRYFPRWHPFYRRAIKFAMGSDRNLGGQLGDLGIAVSDVRTVVLTHLHWDHVGGLEHFPQAAIVVSAREVEEASGWLGRVRGYVPAQWPSWFRPNELIFDGPAIGSFPASAPITRAGDVVALPTPGHTRGHMSVLVDSDQVRWVLAGDASYTEKLMLRGAIDAVSPSASEARLSIRRLRRLVAEKRTIYLPSHDPEAVERLAASKVTRAAADSWEASRI